MQMTDILAPAFSSDAPKPDTTPSNRTHLLQKPAILLPGNLLGQPLPLSLLLSLPLHGAVRSKSNVVRVHILRCW